MTDDYPPKNKDGIHLGVIPDGNRRYAVKKNKPQWEGHFEGAKKIREFLKWCLEYPNVKRISIFALSTENLKRPEEELNELWRVYKEEFKRILTDPLIKENGVKVRIVGNDGLWRPDIKETVKEVFESTKNYSKHIFNILLAYGSSFELNNAIKNVIKKPMETVDKFLLVKEPLDLLIRTGDQYRLSNFMLFQASYAEIYFSKSMWPEFTKEEFIKIMDWYKEQQRKFGK